MRRKTLMRTIYTCSTSAACIFVCPHSSVSVGGFTERGGERAHGGEKKK